MLDKLQKNSPRSTQEQLELAKAAADGEKKARLEINSMVQPIIDYQTGRFCKRFCHENQYLYRCTLKPPMGPMHQDAAWCEWGNACYGWMLNDLTHSKRLLRYQGINGAGLFDYFYQIAHLKSQAEHLKVGPDVLSVQEMMERFSIRVESDSVSVEATRLMPPRLDFGNDRIDDTASGSWNLTRKKFKA